MWKLAYINLSATSSAEIGENKFAGAFLTKIQPIPIKITLIQKIIKA